MKDNISETLALASLHLSL